MTIATSIARNGVLAGEGVGTRPLLSLFVGGFTSFYSWPQPPPRVLFSQVNWGTLRGDTGGENSPPPRAVPARFPGSFVASSRQCSRDGVGTNDLHPMRLDRLRTCLRQDCGQVAERPTVVLGRVERSQPDEHCLCTNAGLSVQYLRDVGQVVNGLRLILIGIRDDDRSAPFCDELHRPGNDRCHGVHAVLEGT
ncbi:hypothetical protein BJF85_07125 [Saccharomonospora sp. CUA-673]|nr:hypothetical protein BJF85_07125 [Saccharomonospora sp. CUA-673]